MAILGMMGFDDTIFESTIYVRAGTPGFSPGRDGIGQCASGNKGSNTVTTWEWALSSSSYFANSNTIHLGIAVLYPAYSTSELFAFRALGVAEQNNLKFSVDSNGYITFGGVQSNTQAFFSGQWEYVEIALTSIDATHMSAKVKVNGILYLDIASFTITAVTLNSIVFTNNAFFFPTYYDDIYILDESGVAPYNASLGDVFIRTILPTGNGDSSQFVNSAGTSVNNYSYVDEKNSSAADYVGASASGARDLYTTGATNAIPTDYKVYATQGLVYAGKSDAGAPPNLSFSSKGAAGTVRDDTTVDFIQATSYLSQASIIYTTDPDGNPLTPLSLNAMQIGVVSL